MNKKMKKKDFYVMFIKFIKEKVVKGKKINYLME